jgi:hypothetical protein
VAASGVAPGGLSVFGRFSSGWLVYRYVDSWQAETLKKPL